MLKETYEFTSQSIQQRFHVNCTKSQHTRHTFRFTTQQVSPFVKIVWSMKSYLINSKLNWDKLLYVYYIPSKFWLKIIFLYFIKNHTVQLTQICQGQI